MSGHDIQIGPDGRLHHFLSVEGLDREMLVSILDAAERFTDIKKTPLLEGRTVMNLFFEASTRTLSTFELAAKRLSADVLNLHVSQSSTTKGESLVDTLRTLQAMHCDIFVIRHGDSGAADFIARHVEPHVSVINGGDGSHAHPTQAMLDAFTIRRHKPDFSTLTVAIVGDILHSRVARSEIRALNTLGVGELRVVAPDTLLPTRVDSFGVQVFTDMDAGITDADVVIMLRLQEERMRGAYLPGHGEFFRMYGLTQERLKLAKPDALVMHPGPINRGIEIDSATADGPQSVILEQVSNGLAIRMAVMCMVLGVET